MHRIARLRLHECESDFANSEITKFVVRILRKIFACEEFDFKIPRNGFHVTGHLTT